MQDACNDNVSRFGSDVIRLARTIKYISHCNDCDTIPYRCNTTTQVIYISYVDHRKFRRGGFPVCVEVRFGKACSSSDTRMHIEALAPALAMRVAKVAQKYLCTSPAMEMKKMYQVVLKAAITSEKRKYNQEKVNREKEIQTEARKKMEGRA